MDEAKFGRAELRARVVTAWLAGASMREVSVRFGVPTGRVKTIVGATPGVVEERARRDEQAEAVARAAALEWSAGRVGEPLADGAAAVGVPVARLRTLLGERAVLHPVRRTAHQRHTDEEILHHVRSWAVGQSDPSGYRYQVAAKAAQGWPSLTTVRTHFGSWQAALKAAGLTPGPSPVGRPVQWTDEQLVVLVASYFAEASHWSLHGLSQWLAADSSRPSPSLIRHRLGRWPALLRLAVATAPTVPDPPGTSSS